MKKYLLFYLIFLSVFSTNCSKEPSKEKDGINNPDYLFLDVFFGMSRKEFYDYCWDMNKQKIFIKSLFNRIEKESNPHVYLNIIKTLIEFKDENINERPMC